MPSNGRLSADNDDDDDDDWFSQCYKVTLFPSNKLLVGSIKKR